MKTCFTYLVLLFCLNCIEGTLKCGYYYSAVSNAWLKHFEIPATWFDARLRCALQGGVLASPTTQEIATEMTHMINHFFPSQPEIFTGIHATFSQGDFYTVEGIPLSEIPVAWAKNEPNNIRNNENCITLNGNGDLSDRPCENTYPYICIRSDIEVNECGSIDPGYALDRTTNSCYKFHSTPRTFSRAYFTCSAEGGHLAIINSETEAKVLKELFARNPAKDMVSNSWKDTAFVGFSDWDEHGDWRTIHGQTIWEAGYYKFSQWEPNNISLQFCGAIYRTGLLDDFWCSTPAAFICEKDPKYPAGCHSSEEEEEGLEDNSESGTDRSQATAFPNCIPIRSAVSA